MSYLRYHGGWIEVICGCMFSGKSEELIRRIKRAQIARQRVHIFRHALDTRYGEGRIASHSGAYLAAVAVERASQIAELVEPETQVVAIDEVQFFDDAIVDVCNQLADRGVRVIVAGLDTDFRGKPFGAMPRLLAEAELVNKLEAICMVCGAPATRTQRLVEGNPAFDDDPTILVGASEVYEARCRACHSVPRRGAA
ncbi:MAG: thymidine kinase [Chloroflexi bacterium RBG_13_56_8]|nr:MAG: thymidine kinase [Chloroflexi bacterium RBG_13_56_8]